MTSWLDALADPRLIKEAYGEVLPTSDGIELSTVLFEKFGPELRLYFRLVEYPQSPPASWAENSNAATLQIALTPVSVLNLDGTCCDDVVSMTLERSADGVQLRIDGESIRIEARAEKAIVRSLTGYIDERRIPHTPS